MKDSEKTYLKEVFPQHRGRTIKGETLAVYYETERILKQKEQIQKRGCSCEFRSMAEKVHTLYDKWLSDEKNSITDRGL